ncbi:MAG: hypothetical protein U0800_09045 [Isosphaeraceae bacterium]
MKDEPRRDRPAERRRIAEAAAWWMGLTLGSIVLLGGLVLAFLVRIGRRIRAHQPPPAPVPDEFLGGGNPGEPA